MATSRPVTVTPNDAWGPLPPHATGPRRHHALRWLERLLLVIGIAFLGYYAYVSAETALYQAYETRELDAILASVPSPPTRVALNSVATRTRPSSVLKAGTPVGRIEIPRL